MSIQVDVASPGMALVSYATSSMLPKSVVDGGSSTAATGETLGAEIVFFLHLWHSTRLAGHCCLE